MELNELAKLKEQYPDISEDVIKANYPIPDAKIAKSDRVSGKGIVHNTPTDLNAYFGRSGDEKPKRSKEGNIQHVIDGERYGSGKEAVDAQNLRLAVKAGEYAAYFHHVRFRLLDDGTYYEADHVLINNDLTISVLDSKAFDVKTGEFRSTEKFRLKRKMFMQKYGHDIELI